MDSQVQDYIRKLRKAGGIVNRSIILAAATGIVKHEKPTLLREFGGQVELGRTWAESLMKRMGMVKRKSTKAARKVPVNFDELKREYLDRISTTCTEYGIPLSCYKLGPNRLQIGTG
jgi:hypothetical protein